MSREVEESVEWGKRARGTGKRVDGEREYRLSWWGGGNIRFRALLALIYYS